MQKAKVFSAASSKQKQTTGGALKRACLIRVRFRFISRCTGRANPHQTALLVQLNSVTILNQKAFSNHVHP